MNKKMLVTGALVMAALLTALIWNRERPAEDTIAFLQMEPEQLPADVQRWVETARTVTGGVTETFGAYTYLLVAAGEKPTGGYEVAFSEVREAGGQLVVTVSIVAPKPGSAVITAVTYPIGVARIPRTSLPITFHVTAGQ